MHLWYGMKEWIIMQDWICPECNKNELVEMDDNTFKEMCKTIKPNIQVLKKKSKNGTRRMCPKCDAYALGIEMIKGYPVRTKQGLVTEIQKLSERINW